ncbi:MAG: hypothetical protein MK116_09640, partial [Phycisphaerales bacterium]|nr:hypothetical protein [Phycisphaerales bacterium]
LAEYPDPNPRPNADGTNTWYVGNDTQYPVIQDVLNACADGDEIVVTQGQYVESLHIANNDITLRPMALAPTAFPRDCVWADVVFWNPTEGFNNANGYAIRMTGGNNTYVGEPRQFTELANGFESMTTVPCLNANYAVNFNLNVSDITLQTGPGVVGGVPNLKPGLLTFSFASRSIDNCAIYSTDGTGTFNRCFISSQDGYGGGIICTGDSNATQFVSCVMQFMFATGNPLRLADGSTGPGCNVITVTGGRPQFLGSTALNSQVSGNISGPQGCISITGGHPIFDRVGIAGNLCLTANGTIMVSGDARTKMSRCAVAGNISRFGTFYWDCVGQSGPDMCSFYRCNFVANETANGTAGGQATGGIAYVAGPAYGSPPLIHFSECNGTANNNAPVRPWEPGYHNTASGPTGGVQDVTTPFFPICRVGAGWTMGAITPITDVDSYIPGDMNGDGIINSDDLAVMHAVLGTCHYDGDLSGEINIDDLLGVLASYGGTCQ